MSALRNDSSSDLKRRSGYTTENRCGKTAMKRCGEATAVNISRFNKTFGVCASLQSIIGGVDVRKSGTYNEFSHGTILYPSMVYPAFLKSCETVLQPVTFSQHTYFNFTRKSTRPPLEPTGDHSELKRICSPNIS